ncbi:MAG TPA: tRNA (adenosine(37)-N6)-threonylcarbamoyltransferase complex transferase subunit TsaD, partial [candidate division Zixibacteria bacterium]|nr:tRNA (adenosine(37)-N6)-threonylcarbamoyltransferase complex transferase subunit TsaD [candidate division Zixibacteria bacterium]
MITLGVETSCDETAVAVVRDGVTTLSNVILSQKEHSRFGGVVPEIASRSHVRAVAPICFEALEVAALSEREIDLVAATHGPGLVGCLLVGLSFAKGLALALNKPFVAVNHLEGHIAANFLSVPELPSHHLTLIISGGHTLLVEALEFGRYRTLGRTRDDAVGEAFDKVAKLLGLGYPGGQKIDELARVGDRSAIRFPRPMERDESYDFSYSGLKTAVALYWRSLSELERREQLADVAASFQEAAVEALVSKTLRAARELTVNTVTLSGGVAANSRLRELLAERLADAGVDFWYPHPKLCTDNAAMIA